MPVHTHFQTLALKAGLSYAFSGRGGDKKWERHSFICRGALGAVSYKLFKQDGQSLGLRTRRARRIANINHAAMKQASSSFNVMSATEGFPPAIK